MLVRRVFNKKTKERFIIPEGQYAILTDKFYWRAAFLREEYSKKRIFYHKMVTSEIPETSIPTDSYIEFNDLGKVTLQSVLDGDWIEVPDTPASKILYSKN